jgi:hypothetical protein
MMRRDVCSRRFGYRWRIVSGEYDGMRRVVYGSNGASFIPVCEKCSRLVKADPVLIVHGDGRVKDVPNATCSKCGRTRMLFEGYVGGM